MFIDKQMSMKSKKKLQEITLFEDRLGLLFGGEAPCPPPLLPKVKSLEGVL